MSVEEKIQKHPSTAHYEGTRYVHDPLNQPLAEQEAQGLLGARELAPSEHISKTSGYCPHKKLGGHGCTECSQS